MDEIDARIVRLLYADGRRSQEQLARAVNLSRPAVHERVRRLEERGIIHGYKALIDWAAMGQPVTAFVWVRTSGVRCADTGRTLMRLSDAQAVVEECHRVTGEWCMLLKVRTATPLALQDLIDRIREIPGVVGTQSYLALSTLSEHGPLKGE